MKYGILAAVAAMTSAGSAQAGATLTCASVGTRLDAGCSSATSVYVSGPEFIQTSSGMNVLSYDFTDSDLVITNVFSRGFVASVGDGSRTTILAFTNGFNPFTNATLTGAGSAVNNPRVSVKDSTLFVDISGVSWTAGGTATVRLNDAVVAAVPEPATWAMMIAGFGMVGGAVRRRRQVGATVRFA